MPCSKRSALFSVRSSSIDRPSRSNWLASRTRGLRHRPPRASPSVPYTGGAGGIGRRSPTSYRRVIDRRSKRARGGQWAIERDRPHDQLLQRDCPSQPEIVRVRQFHAHLQQIPNHAHSRTARASNPRPLNLGELLLLPKYSADLNHSEQLFAELKHFLPKAAHPARTRSSQAEMPVPAQSRVQAPDRSRRPPRATRHMPPPPFA